MSSKDKYRSLCDTEPSIPIFSRDWWLDIVCGNDKWDVLLVERNGRIQAAMPLYIPVKGIISMPPYTQKMGPWLVENAPDTKYTARLTKRQKLCEELIKKLSISSYSSFLQNFHYDITDWLPFYWAGYQQTTRYTYLLNDLNDTEKLWENMASNSRRNIQKAREKHHVTVRKGISINEFMAVQAKTFERQGLRVKKQNAKILRHLISACQKREQGDIWGGYDTEGHLHAAAFVVWQESSAYYLAGGGDPVYRSSGAHSLVLWECIRHVSQFTNRFDFEGSMLPGVERFFREFGAIQVPFFTISKGKLSLLDRARIKLSKWI